MDPETKTCWRIGHGNTPFHVRPLSVASSPILLGILMYQYFYKIANRLEPRSGHTYVGPDLGSSLFASSSRLFEKICLEIYHFFYIIQKVAEGRKFVPQHTIGKDQSYKA